MLSMLPNRSLICMLVACLPAAQREKRMQLSWACEEQLFRQEVENADDIRLSVRLFRACMRDKKKFCTDVAPGGWHLFPKEARRMRPVSVSAAWLQCHYLTSMNGCVMTRLCTSEGLP